MKGKNDERRLAASVLGAGSRSRGHRFEPHVAGRESLKIESWKREGVREEERRDWRASEVMKSGPAVLRLWGRHVWNLSLCCEEWVGNLGFVPVN